LLIWMPAVLTHYGGMPVPVAWIIYGLMITMQSFFPGAACSMTRFMSKRCGDRWLLLFPLVWVTLEYARTYFPFGGFPWLLTGYSQTRYLSLIQMSDLTGVYGVSFLILWFNAAVAWIWLRGFRSFAAYWPLATGAVLICVSVFYGRLSLQKWGRVEPDHRVAMLQGNLSIDDGEQILSDRFQQGYIRMADRLKPSSVDLLVLPESPSPLAFQYDSTYRQALEGLARRYRLGLVFNNVAYGESGRGTRYFNSAFFLSGEGNLLGRYDKIHLVPFGEYVPLKEFFFFAETISKDVGDFSPGHDYLLVKLESRPVNAVICFEAVFPNLVRHFVFRGSQLVLNLSNDGWYGDSAAPYQHLDMSRWRAVENRRYVLRATNSGISAVIDPTGRIQVRTGLLQEAICRGRFAFLTDQTPYTRYGDAFAIACAIISSGAVIIAGGARSKW